MYYVIQENTFRESHYDLLIECIERFGFQHAIVRSFLFTDKVVRVSDIPDEQYEVDKLPAFQAYRRDVFVFGAIKLARVSAQMCWQPGSLLNANHDYTVYSQHYGRYMLNADSVVCQVSDVQHVWKGHGTCFVRPTLDNKVFTGAVFTWREWSDLVTRTLTQEHGLPAETLVQLAKPKTIQKEIRCWVVGGKVVTASQYKLGSTTRYSADVDDQAIEFAQRMVDIFQLAEAFVIDVCLVDDVWKIVECGCINSAGFYHANIQRLIEAIENHFNPSHV